MLFDGNGKDASVRASWARFTDRFGGIKVFTWKSVGQKSGLVVAGALALGFMAHAHASEEFLLQDLGTRVAVPFDGRLSLELGHPSADIAIITIEDGQVLAEVGHDGMSLGSFASSDDTFNGDIMLLIMDIDQDGFDDIGVIDGVGYGGVNFFWRFYRADWQGQYSFVGTISNPIIQTDTARVYSSSRSGPFWSTYVYRYDDVRASLALIFQREHRGDYDRVTFPGAGKGNDASWIIPAISPDPWEATELVDEAYLQTGMATQPRVYFHDAPNPSARRDAYLVEGDVGTVLDVSADDGWMYVTFTHSGTGRTTEGWMPVGEMVFVQG